MYDINNDPKPDLEPIPTKVEALTTEKKASELGQKVDTLKELLLKQDSSLEDRTKAANDFLRYVNEKFEETEIGKIKDALRGVVENNELALEGKKLQDTLADLKTILQNDISRVDRECKDVEGKIDKQVADALKKFDLIPEPKAATPEAASEEPKKETVLDFKKTSFGKDKPAGSLEGKVSELKKADKLYVLTQQNDLRLRDENGTIVGKAAKGSEVVVTDPTIQKDKEGHEYVKVKSGKVEGYAALFYLGKEKPNLPEKKSEVKKKVEVKPAEVPASAKPKEPNTPEKANKKDAAPKTGEKAERPKPVEEEAEAVQAAPKDYEAQATGDAKNFKTYLVENHEAATQLSWLNHDAEGTPTLTSEIEEAINDFYTQLGKGVQDADNVESHQKNNIYQRLSARFQDQVEKDTWDTTINSVLLEEMNRQLQGATERNQEKQDMAQIKKLSDEITAFDNTEIYPAIQISSTESKPVLSEQDRQTIAGSVSSIANNGLLPSKEKIKRLSDIQASLTKVKQQITEANDMIVDIDKATQQYPKRLKDVQTLLAALENSNLMSIRQNQDIARLGVYGVSLSIPQGKMEALKSLKTLVDKTDAKPEAIATQVAMAKNRLITDQSIG